MSLFGNKLASTGRNSSCTASPASAVRRTITSLAAAASLCAFDTKLAGSVMLAPGTQLPGTNYLEYGLQFVNSSVSIKKVASTGNVFFSSGVQLDEKHILTAAHVVRASNPADGSNGFWNASQIYAVVGQNVFEPTLTAPILRYQVHPTFPSTANFGTGSQVDLVIIELKEPLVNRGTNISNLSIGNNVILNHAGYGQHAVQDQSLQVQDGKIRGFNALSTDASPLFDNYLYSAARATTTWSDTYEGGAANRDSGGGVYYQGQLVGIMISASGGTSASITTTHLDLTRPEIRQWLDAFRMNSTAPTPPKLSLNSQGGNVICLKSSEPLQCFGGRWIPEYSSDLLNWCEFANAFNPTQDGSYECPLYLTGDRQYFRLRWEMKLLAPPEAAPLQENILAMLPAPETQAAEIFPTMQPEMQPAPASETTAISLSTLSAPESSQSLRVVETQNSIFSPQPAAPTPYRPEAISGNQIFAPSPLRSNSTPLVDSSLKLPKIPTEPQESWKLQSPLRLKKGIKPVIPNTRSKKPLQKRS